MIKSCSYCKFSFNTEDRRAKYCSRECYQKATGRPDASNRICVVCGASYTAYDSGAKYCSQKCYNQARQIEARECPTCGKLHTPSNSKVIYCSRKCSKLKHSDSTCSYCGKVFHPRTIQKDKFCSLDCYHASMASEYPRSRLNFGKKDKRLILERDNHRCVKCGSQENLEIDHILAICNGGIRSVENGQTLCTKCHDEKTAADKAIARSRFLDG